MTQSYTAKITKNSLWATVSFIIATLCNFAMSVAITRYFGRETYGQYSYFLWISSVIGILAGFGFQQTVTKFLPKYFFSENDKEKTNVVFRKLLKIQMSGSIIISGLCILGVGYFQKMIQFDQPDKALLLIISFLSVIPFSLNTFLSSSFSAIQEFKKISGIYIWTSILNLILIILFVSTGQSLTNFLWLYLGLTLLSSVILISQAKKLLKKPQTEPALGEKLFSYSLYAYISVLCTQIVWERSELFFLGMFSDSSQIAIYTLSYSLAVLFISVWGPLNGVLNATTSEVVLSDKKDKLQIITQHGTKYLAMLILPLSLFASLFLKDVVSLVYGKSFQDVALLFPFLVIAHAVAVIITPAGSIPMLKHEMKKSMFFNIATAIANIILDIYLIAKYQAFGAMLANVISQFFSIGLSLINAKKYKLGIFNKYMVRVFLINAVLAGLFLGIFTMDLPLRILITAIAAAGYIFAILTTAFNKQDCRILTNLVTVIPVPVRPIFNRLLKIIEKTTHSG